MMRSHEAAARWRSRGGEGLVVPVWPVESLYCLCVQILDGLLVTPADTVLGTCIPIERIDSLGDAHL